MLLEHWNDAITVLLIIYVIYLRIMTKMEMKYVMAQSFKHLEIVSKKHADMVIKHVEQQVNVALNNMSLDVKDHLKSAQKEVMEALHESSSNHKR